MTKTYCDVCGDEFTLTPRDKPHSQHDPEYVLAADPRGRGGIVALADVGDVCPRCMSIGQNLNTALILRLEWRRAVGLAVDRS